MNNTQQSDWKPKAQDGRRYPGEVAYIRVKWESLPDGMVKLTPVDYVGEQVWPVSEVLDLGDTETVLGDDPYQKRHWQGTRTVEVSRDIFNDFVWAELFGAK